MSQPIETPNPATTSRPSASSKRVARQAPLRWLPWVALLLLALIVAGVLLVINAVDDDGTDGSEGDTLSAPSALFHHLKEIS